MSRSSAECRSRGPGGPPKPGRDRGQTEPIAALVALLAVGVGLAVYAGVIADADPGTDRRATADIVLDRVHDRVVVAGVAHPDRLAVPADSGIDRGRIGIVIETAERRWHVGERPATRPYPPDADVARRSVSVRSAPGQQRRGELRVVVGR
ncbi:hypothetical protein [Halopenitus sp. POP-27]|uniref:DUF7285 family protein n=1 Tax=Halopenitus sp. POP-27 TaxID=2994425 RepID=UPI002468360D|nr:hypothetical protein [Halopenitus sp. POP-27]